MWYRVNLVPPLTFHSNHSHAAKKELRIGNARPIRTEMLKRDAKHTVTAHEMKEEIESCLCGERPIRCMHVCMDVCMWHIGREMHAYVY